MKLHELYDALRDMMNAGHRDVEVTVITMCDGNLVADEIDEVTYDSNSNIIEIFGKSAREDSEPQDGTVEDDDPVGEDPGLLVA